MELLYFSLGILFITLLYPVIGQFGDVVLTQLELVKTKLAARINSINLKMQKEESSNIRAIGFVSPEEQENEFDD